MRKTAFNPKRETEDPISAANLVQIAPNAWTKMDNIRSVRYIFP